MGEIAEMMLDGTLCASCGTYMEGEAVGFPSYCSSRCAKDAGVDFAADDRFAPRVPRANRAGIKPNAPKAGQVKCPVCARAVKKAGLGDHVLSVHPETQKEKPL